MISGCAALVMSARRCSACTSARYFLRAGAAASSVTALRRFLHASHASLVAAARRSLKSARLALGFSLFACEAFLVNASASSGTHSSSLSLTAVHTCPCSSFLL